MAARAYGVAMEMTQQYLAGELSVLLERVQAVVTTEAADRDATALRQAAETVPVQSLGWVTVRALALTERRRQGRCRYLGAVAVSPVNVEAGPHTSTGAALQDHRVLGAVGAHPGHADSMAKAGPRHQLDARSDHVANERKQL
jgi:hypothetical protein